MAQKLPKRALTKAAKNLRSKGRKGDTILAHISPREARILQALGGSSKKNPKTGLLEFFHEDEEEFSFSDFDEDNFPGDLSEAIELLDEGEDEDPQQLKRDIASKSTGASIARAISRIGSLFAGPGAGLVTGARTLSEAGQRAGILPESDIPEFLFAGESGIQGEPGGTAGEFGFSDIAISEEEDEVASPALKRKLTAATKPQPAVAPTAPKPPSAATRPSSTTAVVQARALAARRGAARAASGGRASTIVTSPLGLSGDPSTTRKTLRGLNRLV